MKSRSIILPDEIVPLVEMLTEIWQRDPNGKVWEYTVQSIRAMRLVLDAHEAEKRGKPFIVPDAEP